MIIFQGEAATPMDEIQGRLFAVLGGEDPQEVLPLVDQQLMVTEREIAQVPERAQHKGPEFLQQAGEPMQRLLSQLKGYQQWLGQLRPALEQHQHNQIVQAYEEAQELIPSLAAALDEYSKLFASHGTYRTAWANTLNGLAQSIRNEESAEDSWDEVLGNFQAAFSKKIGEVQGVQLPGRSLCARYYSQGLQSLQALQASETLDDGAVQPLLQELDQSILEGEKLERLISEGVQGMAAMPAANVVIHVVRKSLAGELDMQLAHSFVADYRSILDSFWEGFERSVSRPVDSALVRDEIPRTLEYGDAHDGAVESLGNALQQRDTNGANDALEQLIESASKLDESREVFETAAQHQSHAHCPGCGRANPPENRRCEACGNVLPTAEGLPSSSFNVMTGPALEETQQMQMTENVAKLFQACDAVAEGKITDQQFLDELKTAALGLKEYAKELGEIADETADESAMDEETRKVWREQHLPYMQELGASFTEGIKDCEQGLLEMEQFLSDRDPQHLVEGVRMVWEGLGAVHRAQLSLESTLKMLEDVLQEARERGMLTEG
jgi:tetratricopeptide (TPR) repeat protein